MPSVFQGTLYFVGDGARPLENHRAIPVERAQFAPSTWAPKAGAAAMLAWEPGRRDGQRGIDAAAPARPQAERH